jgi:Zn-dependent protease/predicted transcriptional regulator
MKWSWKIGEIAGIGVFVHATFLILVVWIGLSYWQSERSIAAVIEGVGFILALFGCVVLHELGHALAARRYGIATRDITLLPIGGVARLERMPEDPKQEIVVAIAGPLVNVVIAAAIYAGLFISGNVISSEQVTIVGGSFLVSLMLVNVILVLFNLIPAFPMDGGRVLRAVLATKMDYATATQQAAHVGQLIALVFGLLGLFTNPFLVFIALFVWIGAAAEASMAQVKSALGGIPVETAMLTDFHWLKPQDTIASAVELTISGSQKDFPVVDDGEVVGLLNQADMLAALSKRGPDTTVEMVMQTDVKFADSHEMLEAVLARLQQLGRQTMPVTHDGKLVGMITLDNIGEFIMIQAALTEKRTDSPSARTGGSRSNRMSIEPEIKEAVWRG